MQRSVLAAVTTLVLISNSGCQNVPDVPNCRDIDALREDANSNGFMDVRPPPGVEYDPEATVKVMAGNTLFDTDLVEHAPEVGLDPTVAGLLARATDFLVKFTFFLDYGDGKVQVLCQTKPLGPFEIAIEAACPVDSMIDVELIAVVPIFGGIPVQTIPVGLTEDAVDYECGQTVSLLTTKDEDGQVV
ncbi:MAG: hypothetical protein ACE5GE_10115 [Phycisphaerae bacterium]